MLWPRSGLRDRSHLCSRPKANHGENQGQPSAPVKQHRERLGGWAGGMKSYKVE